MSDNGDSLVQDESVFLWSLISREITNKPEKSLLTNEIIHSPRSDQKVSSELKFGKIFPCLLGCCLVVGLLPKPVFVCIPGHALQFWLESPLTRFRPRMITVLSAGGQNQPLLSAGYLFSLEVLSAYQAIFSTNWYLVGKMETNYKIRAE